MGQIDNLGESRLREIFDRLAALEHSSGMNSAAIGRGGIRVHSGGVITIENGGLVVTGTAEIVGQLLASGVIVLSGEVTVSGPLTVVDGGKITAGSIELNPDGSATFGTLTIDPDGKITTGSAVIHPDGSAEFGDMTISATGKITSGTAEINPDGSAQFGQFTIAANGDLESDGSLDINGPATLNNDLTVAAGKKITLGGLTLENTGTGGGTLNFPNGSFSSSTTFGMLVASSVAVEIGAPTLKLSGLPDKTGVTSNLYVDGSGRIWRIT
jgi:hypothetical protein